MQRARPGTAGMRALAVAVALAAVAVAWPPRPASALEVRRGDEVVVPADRRLAGDLVASGRSVEVLGTVEGDLIALAERVVVRGTVGGDVIAMAREVQVQGRVDGDLRAAGQRVAVAGQVAGNAAALAERAEVTAGGSVGGSWLSASRRLVLRGTVAREVTAAAEEIALAGTAGRGARLWVDRLSLAAGARIGGPLVYTSRNEARIDAGATVAGAVSRLEPPAPEGGAELARWGMAWLRVAGFTVTGLALLALLPAARTRFRWPLARRPLRTLAAGLGVLFGLPAAALVLALSLVGLPLAVLSLLALPLAVYLSQIPFSLALGEWLLGRIPAAARWPWPVHFLAGVAATTLLVRAPYAGPLFALGFVAASLGAAVLGLAGREAG